MTKDIKNLGKEVIRTEIIGMQKLYDQLDYDFVNAVELINASPGKIIVTGMGKSGHIARKIAATMSSTGKPSIYLHPAEASHGDLGIIERYDAIIAISNSGETAELNDILEYAKRNGNRIIAITSKENSTLDIAADVSLVLPDAQEACPLGLAPTTSTTLALVLGDAIAVARYRENFSPLDFSQYHPGGKLGSKLAKVSHLMHSGNSIPTIEQSGSVQDAILEISKKALGCVGVTHIERLVGIVTDGDLRRHLGNVQLADNVSEIMAKTPITVTGNMFAAEALKLMNDKKITSLFVIDGGRPVGVLHIHDLLRAGIG